MLSYWVEKWFIEEGVGFGRSFWECVLFDGTVNGHRSLFSQELLFRFGPTFKQKSDGVVIHPPLKEYFIIRNESLFSSESIRFLRYTVSFLPSVINDDDLSRFKDFPGFHITHFLPHYGIYHQHQCATYENFVKYMEWCVYRSQIERDIFRGSLVVTDNLRLTRSGVISNSSTRYIKFLNFLLLNSLYILIPISKLDSNRWHSLLMLYYNNNDLWVDNEGDSEYYLDGKYLVSQQLIDAVGVARVQIPEVQLSRSTLYRLLDNFLSMISYNSYFVNPVILVDRKRSQIVSKRGVRLSALCLGDEIRLNERLKISFNVWNYPIRDGLVSPLQNFTMMGVLIAGIESDVRLRVNEDVLIEFIHICNLMQPLKVFVDMLYKSCNMYEFFREGILSWKEEKDVFLNLGFALLACGFLTSSGELEFIKYEHVNGSDRRFLFKLKGVFRPKTGITAEILPEPIICSVIQMAFKQMEYDNNDGELTYVPFDLMCSYLNKVLIFKDTKDKSMIGISLSTIFRSFVTEVSPVGSSSTIRGTSHEYQYSQGFSCVISTCSLEYFDIIENMRNELLRTLIKCINLVLPKLLLWKIGFCGVEMQKLVLLLLEDFVPSIGFYHVTFIKPEFQDIADCSMYLCLNYTEEAIDRVYFGLTSTVSNELSIRDGVPAYDLSEMLIQNVEQFFNLRGLLPLCSTTVIADIDDSQIEYVLSIILSRCDQVRVSRIFGTNRIYLVGNLSTKRVFLTRRIATIFGFAQSERYFLSELRNLDPVRNIPKVIFKSRKLGDFVRDIWRWTLSYEFFNTYNLKLCLDYADDFHYIGVGDEKAKNIQCVPIYSPYTIVDPRTPQEYTKFNITVLNELFNYDLERARELINRLFVNGGNKQLRMLFLFMLYNDDPDSAELIRRIQLLSILMADNGHIHEIYFNVYIVDGLLNNFDVIEFDNKSCIFGDLYLSKSHGDPDVILKGTFSTNYDPVSLLTINDVLDAGNGGQVVCYRVNPTLQHLYEYMWLDKVIPDIDAASGIQYGIQFSQVFCLRRRVV